MDRTASRIASWQNIVLAGKALRLVLASMAWTITSMPVAAVRPAGRPTVT